MSALRARIFALLTAIAVLLPGGALAPTHYFCRMMERVQPACCCAGAREQKPVRAAELRRQDCCEKLAQPSRARSSAADEAALDLPGPALAMRIPVYAWVGDAVRSSSKSERQARSPPSLGPPLYITHCSLMS